ncbi:tyrosine-type recombinase/integrase [Actinopolyspora lacussalsi]|uniref:tyrosine-type recombinase/integrase n=1 Tax=Actinopolyspora righensis TaxID=995060 RepID=UPI003182FF0E
MVSGNDFQHVRKRAVREGLGLPYNPHALRHWFASTALSDGVSLHEVSRWLGHGRSTLRPTPTDTWWRMHRNA